MQAMLQLEKTELRTEEHNCTPVEGVTEKVGCTKLFLAKRYYLETWLYLQVFIKYCVFSRNFNIL